MEEQPIDIESIQPIRPLPAADDAFPGWASSLFVMLSAVVGFVIIGPLIGLLVAIPFVEGSYLQFLHNLAHPANHPELKVPAMVLQACVTFIGLAVCPAWYWWRFERKNPFDLVRSDNAPLAMLIITALLVMTFMPVNALVVQWNMSVKFPDFLGGFDSWARNTEKANEELVTLLTAFDSAGQFIFCFITISVLAGFSEELIFRGMLQPQMARATGNIHVAIWLTAILFSAFHIQFFGFVPRMLLGALFGYLYYWSGDLKVSMFAHMVNNGVSVIAIYVSQKMKMNLDLENQDVPIPAVIIGAVFTIGLLYYLHSFFKSRNAALA